MNINRKDIEQFSKKVEKLLYDLERYKIGEREVYDFLLNLDLEVSCLLDENNEVQK